MLARGRALKGLVRSLLRRLGSAALSQALTSRLQHVGELASEVERLRERVCALEAEAAANGAMHRELILRAVAPRLDVGAPLTDEACRSEPQYWVRRGRTVRVLQVAREQAPELWAGSQDIRALVRCVADGEVELIEAARLDAEGRLGPWRPQADLFAQIKAEPRLLTEALAARAAVAASAPAPPRIAPAQFYGRATALIDANADLIDFIAAGQARLLPDQSGTSSGLPPPFDNAAALPPFRLPAAPRRRSVLFVHHSYYHFDVMAKALRKRGWDAMTVSVTPHDAPERFLYTPEDLSLYDIDDARRRDKVRAFLRTVPERFEAVQFYGQDIPSLFSENFERSQPRSKVPWDFLELRRHRVVIGYSPSGCLDGASQSLIRQAAQNVCGRCVWELRPDVCNDAKSAAWADLLHAMCDWIGLEGDWAVDKRTGPKYVRGPILFALDPELWHPDIEVDEARRVERARGEILVYHAVANVETRRANGRDIKGSGAVEAAIARLRADGIAVKLFFAQKVPILDTRYYKAQADIVVDQLNYGRIGANARETFMMGKPLITRLLPEEMPPLPPLRSVAEAPALDATEATVADVLRRLALDPALRRELSLKSRAFALRWFAADPCARRFEMVIDRIRSGLPPDTEELYPPREREAAAVGLVST